MATTSFYTEEDANLYDSTIRFAAPFYDLLHEIMMEAVVSTIDVVAERSTYVLDIGCGTGEEALRIAARLPTASVVAFDVSREMLAVFEKKLSTDATLQLKSRIRLTCGDITNKEWSADRLCSLAGLEGAGQRYDTIISAFTFHHFSEEVLADLYRRFHDALRPGGVLVNGDVFDFWSPEISRLALQQSIDYIKSQLNGRDAREVIEGMGGCVSDLSMKWIAHTLQANNPLPIEEPYKQKKSPTRKGNQALLVDSGFADVVCPFRYWQSGVLWAKRV